MKNDKPSLRQRLTAALRDRSRQWLHHFTGSTAQARPEESGTPPGLYECEQPQDSIRHAFSSELFVELLAELPDHQQKIREAYQAGDLQGLRDTVHQLLGAIVYCDAPELESALRSLHRALASENRGHIDICYERTVNTINSTLNYSGYPGRR